MIGVRLRRRMRMGRVFFVVMLGAMVWCDAAAASSPEVPPSRVEPNDNRRAGGILNRGTLTIALRAASGRWQPEGPTGPTLAIEAFGEVGKPLTVPAPLVRVREGTEIAVSLRNDLDTTLVVRGLCTRGGVSCPPLEVPPDQTREVRFRSGPAGTYHYWASTLGAPVPFRELAGALVV